MLRWSCLVPVLCVLSAGTRGQIPEPVIPDGLGVNIHFTDELPGEVAMIAAAGMKLIRMDFSWVHIETEKGRYDFSAYDRLMASLERHGLRPIFILDYAHPLYDDNQSPRTPGGRAAFARFAAAGAPRYRGRGVIWEMYNEPNIAPFWRPVPNVEHYIALAEETGGAVRAVDPDATFIGPATSGIDREFLSACWSAGLLGKFDAVSVHPYTQQGPETAESAYRWLRMLASQPRQPGPVDAGGGDRASRGFTILSGEWGYSDVWAGMDRHRQAKMLARQWLFNLSQGVPVSIWYDWRDDGADPKEAEHHFGMVEHDPLPAGGREPFRRKPAYDAARTLTACLKGFRFNKRLWTGDDRDWVLLFERGDEIRLAAWTTAAEPRMIEIPSSDGEFTGVNMLGADLPRMMVQDGRLTIRADDAPMYLTPPMGNRVLRLAAAWPRLPMEVAADAPGLFGEVTISQPMRNPFDEQLSVRTRTGEAQGGVEDTRVTIPPAGQAPVPTIVRVNRFAESAPAVVTLQAAGFPPLAQRTVATCLNPLRVRYEPVSEDQILIRVENPGQSAAALRFDASDLLSGGRPIDSSPMYLSEGQSALWNFADFAKNDGQRRARLRVRDDGEAIELPPMRFEMIPFAPDGWTVTAEGDEKTASKLSIAPTTQVDHPLNPSSRAMQVDYEFDAGWKYLLVKPVDRPVAITGRPSKLGLWVKGDGSGNIIRCRFVDSAGQTFQPHGEKLTFHNWRYVEFPLDGTAAGHWGGDASGIVRYPITLDTLLLIDSAARQKTGGRVRLATPCLHYEE